MYPYYYRNGRNFIHKNQQYAIPHLQYQPYYSYYPYYAPYRNLPPVDPSLFVNSARSMQALLSSADRIVDKLASSSKYSTDIMTAAQFSKMSDVYELIESLGISEKPIITFTPDGINMQFEKSIDSVDLCHLTVKIRWG